MKLETLIRTLSLIFLAAGASMTAYGISTIPGKQAVTSLDILIASLGPALLALALIFFITSIEIKETRQENHQEG